MKVLILMAPLQGRKQGRLAVPPRGRSLGSGAAIVSQFQQGGLFASRGAPRLKLLAAQFAQAMPARTALGGRAGLTSRYLSAAYRFVIETDRSNNNLLN